MMLLLLIVSTFSRVMCQDSMEVHVNPGCQNCTADDQLVYARSRVSGETYHFVWSSLSQEDPAFLLVHSEKDAPINIDWNRLLTGQSGSLTVEDVKNDIGLVIRDILLFNDTEKAGTFNQSDPHVVKKLRQKTTPRIIGHFDADGIFTFSDEEESNMTVTVTLSAAIHKNRFVDLPHLIMSPSSFHVQVVVAGDPLLNYTNCRVILDMDLFHRKIPSDVAVITETTIDDEFSPGVFSETTAKIDANPNSYVQWKPVAYNKADRIIAHTVDISVSVAKLNASVSSSVMTGYSSSNDFEVSSVRFCFGAAKDTFYSEYQYTDFSFVVGLGVPEKDGLSFLVQVIIWIGFGIPVLALITASIYLTVKRVRARVSERRLLQD
jgi:hypothetical protein